MAVVDAAQSGDSRPRRAPTAGGSQAVRSRIWTALECFGSPGSGGGPARRFGHRRISTGCVVPSLLVNLGCGAVFHPAWVNLDSLPVGPGVRRWDLRRGLPFEDASVEACYASHVIEHLPSQAAGPLLEECRRVLRPRGTLRLVVPDLEEVTRAYLQALEKALAGVPGADQDHDWMIVELLDQLVRAEGGGEMHRRLTSGALPNPQFVIQRLGLQAEEVIAAARRGVPASTVRRGPGHYLRRIREETAIILTGILLGQNGRNALREGLFRCSGQPHRWMYDRLSLRCLLEQAGFTGIAQQSAAESRIPGFASYDLDTLAGRVLKPDSLFMEAVKP